MSTLVEKMPDATRLALKEAARNAHYALNDLGLPVTSNVSVAARNVLENLILLLCPTGSLFPLIMALQQPETVAQIVQRCLDVEADEAVPTASFIDDLGADSLDTIEIIMEVEKAYGLAIPDEVAETIKTVQQLQDVVDNARKGKE